MKLLCSLLSLALAMPAVAQHRPPRPPSPRPPHRPAPPRPVPPPHRPAPPRPMPPRPPHRPAPPRPMPPRPLPPMPPHRPYPNPYPPTYSCVGERYQRALAMTEAAAINKLDRFAIQKGVTCFLTRSGFDTAEGRCVDGNLPFATLRMEFNVNCYSRDVYSTLRKTWVNYAR